MGRAGVCGAKATMGCGMEASQWALLHGLAVSSGSSSTSQNASSNQGCGWEQATPAPVSMRPTPFPKNAFQQAKRLAQSANVAMRTAANKKEFLLEAVAPAAEHDPFTKRLVDLLVQGEDPQAKPPNTWKKNRLGVLRADYMVDQATKSLLQVEINTIASSFAALATRTSEMHRTFNRKEQEHMPVNDALAGVADALATAALAYQMDEGKGEEGESEPKDVVLFVVQPNERNIFDQLWIADRMWELHGVSTIRASLEEVADNARLDENGSLWLNGKRVSVAYFRAGYSPDDYPSEKEWEGRARIHASNVCECPDVALHLAGTKKVQQMLAVPGTLEGLLGEKSPHVDALRECFAGLWSLDGSQDTEAVQVALANPKQFVLKPQREGGGNNIYGEDILPVLRSGKGLGGYILMQRIFPPLHRAPMLRNGEVREVDAVSELGIYSVFLEKDGQVLIDEGVGHLLRTKAAESDEGGVAAGFAVLDSPLLVEDEAYWASL